jgi:hypothetical protein
MRLTRNSKSLFDRDKHILKNTATPQGTGLPPRKNGIFTAARFFAALKNDRGGGFRQTVLLTRDAAPYKRMKIYGDTIGEGLAPPAKKRNQFNEKYIKSLRRMQK